MRIKSIISYLLFILCYFIDFSCLALSSSHSDEQVLSRDHYVQALASLLFHTHEREKNLTSDEICEEGIVFSDEDVTHLWDKVSQGLCLNFSNPELIHRLFLFEKAHQHYQHADYCIQNGESESAQNFLNSSSQVLHQLWQEALELEEKTFVEFSPLLITRAKKDPNFHDNPHIPSKAQNAMKSYLLPLKHSKRSALDSIFSKSRATTDRDTFYKAGFRIIAKGPRSYIRVAKHPKLRGYLVKAYLDTELKKKRNKESWEWLVRRCEGASQIRKIIQRRNICHFVVPDKWIYCLPAEPSPPNDHDHTRHLALLLVTDMKLTSKDRNYHAWYRYISEEHLDELFEIISRAKGSSYRPDNIAYTKNDQFAFIDTEYPTRGPDFTSIRKYLNPDMCYYWDQLVIHGGPSTRKN